MAQGFSAEFLARDVPGWGVVADAIASMGGDPSQLLHPLRRIGEYCGLPRITYRASVRYWKQLMCLSVQSRGLWGFAGLTLSVLVARSCRYGQYGSASRCLGSGG
jgi:hypothetical protein